MSYYPSPPQQGNTKRVVPPSYQGPPAFPVNQSPKAVPSAPRPSGGYAQHPSYPQQPVSASPGGFAQQQQSNYAAPSPGGYAQQQQSNYAAPSPGGYAQQQPAAPGGYAQQQYQSPSGYGQQHHPVSSPAGYGQQNHPVSSPTGYGQHSTPGGYGQSAAPQPGTDWFSSQSMALGAAAFSVAASDPSKVGQFVSTAFGLEGGPSNSGWFMSKLGGFKEYFNVTHAYVRWKLLFVLFPFLASASAFNRSHSRNSAVPSNDGEAEDSLRLFPGRRPDLYIPLMGYISYILLFGLSRGPNFHPDDLYNVASLAGVLVLLEILLVKGAAYILTLPTLTMTDIVAVCGYKFANLCFSLLGLIFFPTGRSLWIALWLWASLTAGLVVRKGLLSAASYNAQSTHYMGTANPEKLVAAAAAAGQLLWCWLLMPAFVPLVTQALRPEATIPDLS